MKIAVLTSSFEQKKILTDSGLLAVFNSTGRKVTVPELIDLAADCEGVIAGLESYSAAVLKQLPKLKVISRVGVGLDAIDLGECKKRNIRVSVTAEAVVEPVAELALALILNLLRRIESQSFDLKSGNWKRRSGNLLEGKTVGIVGMGRIGRRVAELLRPFRCRLIASDVRPFESNGIEPVAFEKLICEADVISLHCNADLQASPLINRAVLKKMKKGVFLINTARGSLVEEAALADELASGHIGGAALDVFSVEPYQGALCQSPNVILTPHIGSFAAESRAVMECEAIENLLKGLK